VRRSHRGSWGHSRRRGYRSRRPRVAAGLSAKAPRTKGSERALGRGDAITRARVDRHRLAQRPGQRLEAALGDVVVVVTVEGLDMQGDACIHGKGLEE